MKESYVQALLKLIREGKKEVADIKDVEYKAEVESRLSSQ